MQGHHDLKYQLEQEDQELGYQDQGGEDQGYQDNQSHKDQWDQTRAGGPNRED